MISYVSAAGDTTVASTIDDDSLPVYSTDTQLARTHIRSKYRSWSMYALNRSMFDYDTNDKCRQSSPIGRRRRLCLSSKLPVSYYSHCTLYDRVSEHAEPVWIQRCLSNRSLKQLANRHECSISKEILDVTV
jgi:hypothetical protein